MIDLNRARHTVAAWSQYFQRLAEQGRREGQYFTMAILPDEAANELTAAIGALEFDGIEIFSRASAEDAGFVIEYPEAHEACFVPDEIAVTLQNWKSFTAVNHL